MAEERGGNSGVDGANVSFSPGNATSNSGRVRPGMTVTNKYRSIRHAITFSERKFDITTLPEDQQRVFGKLKAEYGEEYALLFIFTMRTAVELHRAWHMTLLTSKVLQQIKDKFNMRMTWNLGVLRLIFRVEDGGFELHRKVPYDYDSEFQDLYMKIAVALVEGHINIHEALLFQAEAKAGLHTAKSGLFLRDFPGRLILYPFEAATCAVIFFGGDWLDCAVAAICGLAAGIVDWITGYLGGDVKVLVDLFVGIVTGMIGSLFYRFDGQRYCLESIFLGTLYWFFYGTAFVVGLLEIIAGELQTGVTRFIAVSVKTFVLCLGASIGMQMTLVNSADVWSDQKANCGTVDLGNNWWRIPLYLACSISVLGQYRFPIVNYWRGLTVQLAAYEVQFQSLRYFARNSANDFLDTAASNILGDMAAVLTATILAFFVDNLAWYYNARVLQRHPGKYSALGECMYSVQAMFVRLVAALGLGRRSDKLFLEMEKKLQAERAELENPDHARQQITLNPEEERLLVEAIVSAEEINVWSVLMPAVYQLVPGSLIARLWFSAIFPPPPDSDLAQDSIFSNLMVTSTSLALGLLLGFALVQIIDIIYSALICCRPGDKDEEDEGLLARKKERENVMDAVPEDDPEEEEIDFTKED